MMNDTPVDVQQSSKPRRHTSAGRLLEIVTTSGGSDLARLSHCLKIPARRLQACRDGLQALEPEQQVLLAAAVLELAPEHGVLARRLHAQAQSALHLRDGVVESHSTYVGRRWP